MKKAKYRLVVEIEFDSEEEWDDDEVDQLITSMVQSPSSDFDMTGTNIYFMNTPEAILLEQIE
jgi:hypothetical protein